MQGAHHGAVPSLEATQPLPTIRAICLPSADRAFARLVDHWMSESGARSPGHLEQALQPLFPYVKVSPRQLSGEAGLTWYVYRDGRFQARADDEWWETDSAGRAILDRETGDVLEADACMGELLRADPSALVGRSYVDFIPSTARDLAVALFDVTTGLPLVETVARLLRADGSVLDVEIRGQRAGDRLEIRARAINVVVLEP